MYLLAVICLSTISLLAMLAFVLPDLIKFVKSFYAPILMTKEDIDNTLESLNMSHTVKVDKYGYRYDQTHMSTPTMTMLSPEELAKYESIADTNWDDSGASQKTTNGKLNMIRIASVSNDPPEDQAFYGKVLSETKTNPGTSFDIEVTEVSSQPKTRKSKPRKTVTKTKKTKKKASKRRASL